jgi:hypothetical protein
MVVYHARGIFPPLICFLTIGSKPHLRFRFSSTRRFKVALSQSYPVDDPAESYPLMVTESYHWRYCLVSLLLLACLMLPISLVGCAGSGGEPCSVTGSVTLNAEPIKTGTIVFEPMGHGGARGGAKITDGQYQIATDGEMWAGTFTVRIIGFRETGKTTAAFESFGDEPVQDIAEVEEIVPRKYNSESTLQVTLNAGKNTQVFEMTGERTDLPEDDGPDAE